MQLISLQFHGAVVGDPWLPLRTFRDADDNLDPVPVPEWRGGVSATVALCGSLAGNGAHVAAVVQKTVGDPAVMFVRAPDASGNNLLGSIAETRVDFQGGAQATVILTLPQARAGQIAAHIDQWNWQQRPDSSNAWTVLASTQHEVFVTLEPPQSPWDAAASGPAVEVLRIACAWAAGASSWPDAASLITAAFYALGTRAVSPFGWTGKPFFSGDDAFDCAGMIAAINRKQDRPQLVNCEDCSASVTTFSNSLGAQLREARIGVSFDTRPVQVIGQRGMSTTNFSSHEFAWSGAFQPTDPLWDACLMVDQDSDPGSSPYTPGNAQGMVFGTPTNYGYLWRLVDPRDAAGIYIVESFNPNRPIGRLDVTCPPVFSENVLQGQWFFWNFQILNQFLAPWELRQTLNRAEGPLPGIDSTWRTSANGLGNLVRVRAVAANSSAAALAALETRRAAFTSPVKEIELGDRAYALQDRTQISFCRGNLLIDMGAAARPIMPVADAAQRLDAKLIEGTAPSAIAPTPVDISDWAPIESPPGNPLYYRIYTPSGEVRVRDGRLQYYSGGDGTQTVIVYQYDSAGHVTQTVHTLL